jgi:hypothetical protein
MFLTKSIYYLGHTIDMEGLHVGKNRLKDIHDI